MFCQKEVKELIGGATSSLSWGVRLLILRGFVFFLVIDTLQKNSFRLKRTKAAHVGFL